MELTLTLHPEPLAVCRLAADAPVPDWASGSFTSVTRSATELSVVCAQRMVPSTGVRHKAGLRALEIAGPLDFALTGVLASVAAPLNEADVPILAIATFDTDWILIHTPDLERALTALESAGHQIRPK